MKRYKKIKGTLSNDWLKKYDGKHNNGNLMLEAMSNPDLLSDEDQTMFPERDFDGEEARSKYLNAFKIALNSLTIRQKQVINALQYLTQEEAAISLGITRGGLAASLYQIQNKLKTHINKLLAEEQE